MKRNKSKIIAVLLVFTLLIPIIPNQNKVNASAGLVDIRFFNAMVTVIGVTAVGITGMMSQQFSIPEVDMVALKDQFQTTLDGDATKKAAWMKAQTEYLAGGVAKTMGAVELAKIGINDIYLQFNDYLKNYYNFNHVAETLSGLTFVTSIPNFDIYVSGDKEIIVDGGLLQQYGISQFYRTNVIESQINKKAFIYAKNLSDNSVKEMLVIDGYINGYWAQFNLSQFSLSDRYNIFPVIYFYLNSIGAVVPNDNPFRSYLGAAPVGTVNVGGTSNIINTDAEYIHVFPTVPWIDTTVPIGTVVTPAISVPYAGAVPIDVPISVPIDPTDPTDPTAPTYPDVLSATLAIIAALVPISGLLDNIKVGVGDIGDVIDTGLDSVIDGIGDISGTLTGGITSSLTDIQSSLSTLTAPATETINLDPVKNIPKILFTKFPFSIPWDIFNVYNLMATDNRTAPIFKIAIPLSESTTLKSFGMSDLNMELKFDSFSRIFEIIRVAELLLFTAGLIYATKRLVWS